MIDFLMDSIELNKTAADTIREGQRVRKDGFSTKGMHPRDQFEYWRSLISPILEVEHDNGSGDGFLAQGTGFDLGKLHYVTAYIDPMRYRRTEESIRDSDMDHWILSLRRDASVNTHNGDGLTEQRNSPAMLNSLAFPFNGQYSSGNSINIFLSRDNNFKLSDALDVSINRPMEGIMNNIVKEYILSLDRYVQDLTIGEIPVVANSISVLLSAALKPNVDQCAEAALPISTSLFDIARRQVIKNLRNPALGPESLCRALRISRRQLYYIFERRGGIAKYIRQRRLAACHEAIEDLTDHRLISSIAYGFGFTNAAQFSRHFQSQYGYSPTEAREARIYGYIPQDSVPKTFTEWLLQVRGA